MRAAKWLMSAWLVTCWWGAACSVRAADADFPLPATLEPAVGFWVKVYTQADTESGFLHDDENLSIIYEKLPRDRELIDQRRNQIVNDLQVLATGKRSGLSNEQLRLLELWGEGTTNATFKLAAQNVRWQLGQSDRYQDGLRRSGAYLPHIRAVARSLGVPEELAALPHVESSFHPGATSSVAATGMFQFMRETAQRFMRVDAVVDERLDPYKAAYGAMKLLKENYEDLGTWPLALTAYNHGTNGMLRAVRDAGTRDIGEIVEQYKGPRFGFASRNFYAQFLAAREVEKNAERYFGPMVKEGTPEFSEYTMNGFVDATVLAKSLGVSLEALRNDNPALLAPVWSGSKRIPKGYVVKLDKLHFRGDLAKSIASIAANELHASQVQDQTYTVRKGDSLSQIAGLYKISVAELVAINQLKNRNAIRVGQKLVLPQANGAVPTLIVNSSGPDSALAIGGRYTVQRGDTLSKIADRFKISEAVLMALNGLRNANAIQLGQQLLVKSEGTAASAPAQAGSVTAELDRSVQLSGGSASQSAITASTAGTNALALSSMVHSMNPADYAVAGDGTIEVLPEETLGHYADWLRVNSKDLYSLNALRSEKAVRAGMRLKLDFSRVDRDRFASRRQQFHTDLQAKYFNAWRVQETTSYEVQRSDSVMSLTSKNSVPMWLFRQYNPGVDASRLQPGQTVIMPRVERLGAAGQ